MELEYFGATYILNDTEDSMLFNSAQEAFDWREKYCSTIPLQVNINPHNINFALNTKTND